MSSNFLRPRGFTLIELMIVVAIVGVLAVLAVFGVRKYLANAKSAEAANVIGTMNQQAVQAYEREVGTAEIASTGGTSQAAAHQFCGAAAQVPAIAKVKGIKYTPIKADYLDRVAATNDEVTGWMCLGFEMAQPQYYAYKYNSQGGPAATVGTVSTAAVDSSPDETNLPAATFLSCATGDLDGNGTASLFCLGGIDDPTTHYVHTTTQIYMSNPQE